MTRPVSSAIRSLLLAALLLPIGSIPTADAWNQADGVQPPESVSPFPEQPLATTNVDPIDDVLEDGADAGAAANEAINGTYQVLGAGLNDARQSALRGTLADQPITLLRDGIETGGDRKERGGYGDWQVLGDAAWAPDGSAAFAGQLGYTQATLDGGRYRGNTASLLVSPEIDLETQFVGGACAAPSQLLQLLAQAQSVDSALLSQRDSCRQAFPSVHSPLMGGCESAAAFFAFVESLCNQPHLYSFEYTRRFNLAINDFGTNGRDGVTVMVFAQEPTVFAANMCARVPGGPCTIVEPETMYPFRQIDAMPAGYPGYSGSSNWGRDSIDLTPWEGQQVWVGFYFASDAIPSQAYWENPARFNTGAGFVGFQLDDVEAKAPAASVNLKARVPIKPDFVPESLLGTGAPPTLGPGVPILAAAEVANLGTTTLQVRAVLRILAPDGATGTVPPPVNGQSFEYLVDDETLNPGEILLLEKVFPGLPAGDGYGVQVCATRVDADPTFCDEPPQDMCRNESGDADPCDDWWGRQFNVGPVVDLDVGTLQRDAAQISRGDTLSMVLPLANKGNVPLTFTVRASVVDVTGGDPTLRQDMLDEASEGQELQTVTLQPEESIFLNWSMKGLDVGQFHLLLDIRDGSGNIDFDPVHDMLPAILRPWHASALTGNITVDGMFRDNEGWIFHTVPKAIPGGSIRVGNTADRLYLGFESPAPVANVLFGDGNPEGQSGYLLGTGAGMTRMQPMRFNATGLTWGKPFVSLLGANGIHEEGGPGQAAFQFTRFDPSGNYPHLVVRLQYDAQNSTVDASDIHTDLADLAIHFADRSATASLRLTPRDDGVDEGAETFAVRISPDPSIIAPPESFQTFLRDGDGPIRVAIARAPNVVNEESQDEQVAFTVTRSGTTNQPLPPMNVKLRFLDNLPSGNATKADFITKMADLNVTFPAGSTSVDVKLTPASDTTAEGPEVITLQVEPGAGFVPTDGKDVARNFLVDADGGPGGTTFAILAYHDEFTEEGGPQPAFLLARSGTKPNQKEVAHLRLMPSQADAADFADDMEHLRVTFPPNAATATLFLTPVDDLENEGAETFTLTILGQSNFASAQKTLVDDDAPASVTIFAGAVALDEEGPAAQPAFTLMRSAGGGDALPEMRVALSFLAASSSADPADFADDLTRLSVTFPEGEAQAVLALTPIDDNEDEGVENIAIRILDGLGYVGGGATATQTLFDEDGAFRQARGARSAGLTPAGRYTYELSVPLGVGPGGSGTSVGPGDDVSVLLRFCTGLAPHDTCQNFPFGAPLRDGDGILLADQELEDELSQWHKIRLSDGVPPGVVPLSKRILGPGFGVNSVPPPYLMADFSDCPSFHGWSTTRTQADGVTDSWTCGAYPDDGRTLLYEGVTPDSQCDGGCKGYAVDGARTLTTPAFTIPSDAVDPTVVLAHQYSTKVRLHDMEREVGQEDFNQPTQFTNVDGSRVYLQKTTSMPRAVFQDSRLQAFLEVWNETANQFDATLLRPDGGYTTEADAGIEDPRFERIFLLEGTGGWPNAADDPADDTDPSSIWNATVQEPRGWWWPQGLQPMYQAPDRPFATGGEFAGGSPWTTDTIRLGDAHFGAQPDLRGKTVRLRFEHALAPTWTEVGDVRLDDSVGGAPLRPEGTFGTPVSLVDVDPVERRANLAQLPLSRIHPFTAVCWIDDGDGAFTANDRGQFGSDIAILTTNANGCDGTAQGTDLPLMAQVGPQGRPAGVPLGTHVLDCQALCPKNLVGRQYQSLPAGTVFDWVDDGDGVFGWGDRLYLNVGGGDQVEPRDILISSGAFSTVPSGAPGTYCGSTKCGPGAATGDATDIVFYDADGNGQWNPNGLAPPAGAPTTTSDRAYFPPRVFNSGDVISFNRSQDWGWRIGGLAVIEGPRFVRDLALEDAVPLAGPDALERGVGPGTDVPVRITVRNLGSNDLGGVFVGLVGENAGEGAQAGQPPMCSAQRSLGGIIVHGESREVVLACPVPAGGGIEGQSIAFRARVWREGGGTPEDFLGNNQQRVRGILPIRASPDAAIHAGVSPQDATADTPRTLTLRVENRGNVPLDGVTVDATISKVLDDGRSIPFYDKSWTMDTVGLGKTATLSEATVAASSGSKAALKDLTFNPPGAGRYVLVVDVSTPGDIDPSNDRADAPIRALTLLYQDTLDSKGFLDTPGIVAGNLTFEGTPGIWTQQPNSHDGTTRLVAGDPRTGEIPAGTDASIRLPTVDLRTLLDATLSFRHRYDLEAGFDAARVEISADGGKTWEPAIPRAQPEAGLPDGYPSTALVGLNAILGDDVEATALAYTGRSEDLEGDRDGWIAAEFDLTRQGAFFKPSVIDDLILDGLAPDARKKPLSRVSGPSEQHQFTHLDPALKQAGPPYWSLDESGWFADHRYWWIENRTYSAPISPNGGKTWWSGSAGTAGPGETLPRIATRLELDLDGLDPSGWALDEGEDVVLSWWDWRAGWNDGDQRGGTGGEFHATLLTQPPAQGGTADSDGDGLSDATEAFHTRSDPSKAEVEVRIEETLDSGWTRRSIPLSRVLEGGATGVAFTYLSGEADGIGVPLLTPRDSGPKNLTMAYHQDNLGWFIDGVEVAAKSADGMRPLAAYDIQSLFLDKAGKGGDWTAVVADSFPGAEGNSEARWALVGPGAASRDGGWHLEETDVPGRGATTAWRFSSDDPEGYPAGANSRIVTPLVDLRDQDGERISLRFDHKYGFHGGQRAIDAGAVAYQVYDDATGGFGPWTALGAKVPDDVGFLSKNSRQNWAMVPYDTDPSDPTDPFDAMGYPSMAVVPPGALGGGSIAFTTGFGQDIPAAPGFIRTNFGGVSTPKFVGDYWPWHAYAFAYAFSGDSEALHPDTDGWDAVEWDVSHLVGEKVRFGFQAWTNPSQEPCSTSASQAAASGYPPAFFGTPRGCSEDPRHGWTVANVAVVGRTFQGGLADIRLRVATDGSFNKGEWSIDDIQVAGTRFQNNVVPRIAPDTVHGVPASTVTFEGEVVNLGTETRPDLLLGVSAFRKGTEIPVAVTLDAGPPLMVDRDGVPERVQKVYGPFQLSSVGATGSQVGAAGSQRPVRASLVLPPAPEGQGVEVEVRFEVLEGRCTLVGGGCVTSYGFARNEVGGAAATTWTLTSESRLDLRFAQPREDRNGLLVVDPGTPGVGEEVNVVARIANHGTLEPAVQATWTVDRILRKGDSQAQVGMRAANTERAIEPVEVSLGTLHRGDQVDVPLAIDPAESALAEGLYRVTLTVDPGEGQGDVLSASVEFVVGTARPYYRVDFSQQSAAAANWMDVSPSRDNGTGSAGSPDGVRFRQVGDQFLWGVSDAQDGFGVTYCNDRMGGGDVCNSSATGGTIFGLQGMASGPRIDLGRVVNDRAVLTLQHGFEFEHQGDGGRLEILPLRTPVINNNPVPAYTCEGDNGSPAMWFVLPAQDPSALMATVLSIDNYRVGNMDPNTAVPQRVNPINEKTPMMGGRLMERVSEIPAFGGQDGTGAQTVQFWLNQTPQPVCPSGSRPPPGFTRPSSLLNYTVQLGLNVGTLPGLTWGCQTPPQGTQGPSAACAHNPPGGRPGRMGWQIDSISISSIDVAITPENRSLPVFDGHLKRFSFLVTNLGQVEETFGVSLDGEASAGLDESWFDFPHRNITLAPGQTGTFSFGVDVPHGSPPGDRRARLVLRSAMDENVADFIDLDLRLDENPLPDLTVQLTGTSANGGNEVEQGTVVQLSTTVYNVGLKESESVPVELHVTHGAGGLLLGSKEVGRLCPYTACGDQGSRQTVVFDWQVPQVPGAYTLIAKVDPAGKTLEMSKAQNNATLLVNVTPLQRPDVAVTDLHFEGLDAQGFALEGDLVTIVANITNRGRAPATDVPVRIIQGTAEIYKVSLGNLQPDESRLVTTSALVSRGEVPIIAASAPSGQDTDVRNNELRRVLRVRGLDFQVEPPGEPLALRPGESGVTHLNVTNDGNVVERVLLQLHPAENGWGLAVSPNPVTVAPGTTASVLVTIVAPSAAVGGLRALSLSATPQSQASASVPVLLPVRVATSDGAPEIIVGALDGGTLTVRLVAQRNTAENLSLALTDPAWDAVPANVSLGPYGNASVALPVVPLPGTPPGMVRVTVEARNETGALRAEAQGTVLVPRLVSGSLSWAGVVEPHAKDLSRRLIEYRVNITNTGNVPFVPAIHARDLPDGFAQVDAKGDFPPVPPGSSVIVSAVLETGAELTGQVHGVLEVQARDLAAVMQGIADGAEPATRTAVAIGRLDIPTIILPDLEVVRVRMLPVGQVAVGEPVQISVTVRNIGVVRSGASELFAFINGDLVNAYPTVALEPGAETVVNLTWVFTQRGEHLVYVMADGPGTIPEIHSDNNGQSLVMEATQSQMSRLADRDIPLPSALPLALAALALLALRRRRPGGSA